MKFIPALLCVCFCASSVFAQPNCQDNPGSAVCTLVNVVDTTIAYGTLELPSEFGGNQNFVRAGTLLSYNVVELLIGLDVVQTYPLFLQQQLIEDYATLSRLAFLTDDLVQFGNAGVQIVTEYEDILFDLETANPSRTFTLTFASPNSPQFENLGTDTFNLFGGVIQDAPTPGDVTVVTGVANIDIYRVNASISISPIPEPTAIAQLGFMLLLVSARRYRRHE
jgi:hypothetical protein